MELRAVIVVQIIKFVYGIGVSYDNKSCDYTDRR